MARAEVEGWELERQVAAQTVAVENEARDRGDAQQAARQHGEHESQEVSVRHAAQIHGEGRPRAIGAASEVSGIPNARTSAPASSRALVVASFCSATQAARAVSKATLPRVSAPPVLKDSGYCSQSVYSVWT